MSNPKKVTVVTLALLAGTAGMLVAGPLNPPAGSVASTFKTLGEVEPRIAINATNTPGDADATPSLYKITQPGSYYLTGNMTGVAGMIGIEVTAYGVTIDLNGFQMSGGAGSAVGISIRSGGTEVRNGIVRNWGGGGVVADGPTTSNRVIDVRALGNGGVGIYAGNYSEIRNCVGESNASHGLAVYAYGRVEGCTVRYNGGDGVNAPNSSNIVINCNANANTGNGIRLFSGTISGCLTSDNTLSGIDTNSANVHECSSVGNDAYGFKLGTASVAVGNRANGNVFDGFYVEASCVLENNLAAGNGNSIAGRAGFTLNGAGIRATNNHAVSNPIGFQATSGASVLMGNSAMSGTTGFLVTANTNTLLTSNIAVGNSSNNFFINAGNDSGSVVINPGVGFTTTNPVANYGN